MISVVVKNSSRRPLVFFADGNSWGDYTIRFQMIDDAGKTYDISQGPRGYTANAPIVVRVLPGECWVRNINVSPDGPGWVGFPTVKPGETLHVKLRAIMSQTPKGLQSKEIWSGEVQSEPVSIDLLRGG